RGRVARVEAFTGAPDHARRLAWNEEREGLPGPRSPLEPEDALGGAVQQGDGSVRVDLDDGVHDAVEQAAELLLALRDGCLSAHATQLGRSAGGEDAQDRQRPLVGRQRSPVEHREMPEHGLLIHVEQRHAEEADGGEAIQVVVAGVELDDVLGNVHGLAAANDLLAWRARDRVVVAIDEIAVEPEAEGAEVLLLLIELRDPRGAGVQRLGEVAGERAEERPAGLGAGSLDHAPQRSVRVDLLEWLRHAWPVSPATGPIS